MQKIFNEDKLLNKPARFPGYILAHEISHNLGFSHLWEGGLEGGRVRPSPPLWGRYRVVLCLGASGLEEVRPTGEDDRRLHQASQPLAQRLLN